MAAGDPRDYVNLEETGISYALEAR
jgi:hypothetical protein